jgi:hypothetical protein
MNQLLSNLVEKAVGNKEKPSSPWMGVLYVFLAFIVIGLVALPAILARRRAAKIAHERDLLLEERKQARVREKDSALEEEKKAASDAAQDAQIKIIDLENEAETLRDKRDDFIKSLSGITSWEEL